MNKDDMNNLKTIADLAFTFYDSSWDFRSDTHNLEDRRDQSVNPFYGQTKQGFILEVYYGIPGDIYTPLGKWNCFGSGSGYDNGELDRYLESIGAVMIQPKVITSMGEFGPLYAITKVNGVDLPYPEQRSKSDFIPYEEALKAWEDLNK